MEQMNQTSLNAPRAIFLQVTEERTTEVFHYEGLNGGEVRLPKPSSLARLREAGHAAVYRAAGGSRELVGLWLFVVSTLFGTGMSLCAKLLGDSRVGYGGVHVRWGPMDGSHRVNRP